MLIRFEAQNFRSIASAVELSLVAIDRDRPEARDQPMIRESLLPVGAIFGPNASGKSNIIAAVAWVRDAIQHSLRTWDEEIPIEPFTFGSYPVKPSEFIINSVIDDVRFEYILEVSSKRVLYEGLFHYPEKKQRRIFERDESGLKLQRGLGNISGTRELLTERTLALAAARRFDEPLINKFARSIASIQILGMTPRNRNLARSSRFFVSQPRSYSTLRWFEESNQLTLFGEREPIAPDLTSEDRDQALAMLRMADLGIDDVLIDTEEVRYSGSAETQTQRRVRLMHRTLDERVPLDFTLESDGTRTWFQIIGPVLSALKRGSLLLFDELDASLHPTLSAQLVRLFHDPATNPRGAQIVFTSHDTSLLNHLNRDEVWLTEKRPDGSTRLGALADFAGERVRKSQNLESAYLHGRFGALPDVDQVDFLRALGLIG